MVRVLNIVCIALMGLAILGLYRVSEQTRVARMELAKTHRMITSEKGAIAVLETEWSHVAASDRVQVLAAQHGMNDAATAQLSSYDQMPRRVEDAPLNGSPVHNASAVIPVQPQTQPQAPSQE